MQFVPTLVLLLVTPICVLLHQATEYLPFIYVGTYAGWLYLRYFQQQPETTHKGDPSDDFKFSSFFPAFMSIPIDAVANVLSIIFRLRHDPAAVDSKPLHMGNAPSMLGSDAVDANRRRWAVQHMCTGSHTGSNASIIIMWSTRPQCIK